MAFVDPRSRIAFAHGALPHRRRAQQIPFPSVSPCFNSTRFHSRVTTAAVAPELGSVSPPLPVQPASASSAPSQPPSPVTRRSALRIGARALLAPALVPLLFDGAFTAIADESDAALELTRSPLDAKVTDRVYFDMKVGGKELPRIVVGLFGDDAPNAVESFKKVCKGELRGRGGRTVGYAYSQGWRVVKGQRVDLGRVKQIDEINQSPGTPQRQLVLIEVPEHRDVNDIAHAVAGTVSVARGGGKFEFAISTATDGPSADLDRENLVIGRVLEGMETVEAMDNVPTNRKTARDGFRNVGKAIGDGRAKLDLENKPLQKIVIARSGVL